MLAEVLSLGICKCYQSIKEPISCHASPCTQGHMAAEANQSVLWVKVGLHPGQISTSRPKKKQTIHIFSTHTNCQVA